MEIAVLGPVEVRDGDGSLLPVTGARLRTLVVLLALDAGREVTADRLIDGVWGDAPPVAAANALQALVSRLRRAAPGLVVAATPAGYRLVADPVTIDAHRFTRDPAGTLGLWRGDLEFPEVARPEAVRLEGLRLAARRARLAGEMGRRDVVPELEALVAAHPLDEPLAALLVRALRDAGNRGRALEVFEQARRRLGEQLGVDPSAELAGLHLELLRDTGVAEGNLPAEVSSFVGRAAEVRAVRALLGEHRLVTLTGPGGSGKTRLSVEVGGAVAGAVWRVELAPVRDPAELPQTILSTLRLRQSVPPLERLKEALAGREMLLILDNCEHVIEAAAELADVLLRAAPGLRLLATSREPLGITGERLFPVEPLALPPDEADPVTAAAAPAVRLLLDRTSGFELTAENTGPVVRICRALDGMPLAIELAAARLRTLPAAVLADRLADRFRLLTGGSRTALPRHRTLRAVVDWSWDLLSGDERRVWRRLAMLPGGADVTAVERICGPDLDPPAALVDKSLLVLGPDGRYRMLETIREYGLERLAEAGETEPVRRALIAYLIDLAREAEPHLRRADQLVWLRRLSVEHDNLHAAVQDAIAAGDRPSAVTLVANLGWYWWLNGHRTEGARLCAEVIALPGPAGQADLALVHVFAALNGVEGPMEFDQVKILFLAAERLAEGVQDRHPALRLLSPLAAIYSQSSETARYGGAERLADDPDPWLRAISRMLVGQVRLNLGEPAAAAEADLRAALDGFRQVGDRWGIGFTLSSLADLTAARGEFRQALDWQREAMALLEEVGMREDLPQLAVKTAHQVWLSGEPEEARRLLKRAREFAREVGIPEVMASVHHCHAVIALAEGDLAAAREHNATAIRLIERSTFAPQFRAMAHSTGALIEGAAGDLALARAGHRQAIRIAVDSSDSPVIAQVLAGVADLALREGDPARAAFLLGAADAVRGSEDRTVEQAERTFREARAALGDAGFDAAYHRGDGVTMATALAAAGLESDPAAEGPDRQRGEDHQESGRPEQ
ncbi:BTAD domain-containing putative transcriptional regulator [Actinoplanes subglobosus]|uniref:BTAD domain-containing putative transcriptional regulator n=1 Tax=Actinoplanes subglobosus TaxID=1547892 RepID=A0ABV8IM47_9ACTN